MEIKEEVDPVTAGGQLQNSGKVSFFIIYQTHIKGIMIWIYRKIHKVESSCGCVVLIGGSLTAFAYSFGFSLAPIGLGDWKATPTAVYKSNSTMNSYADVTSVQSGGSLNSYISNRYIAQLSNSIKIKTGYNVTYTLNAHSYDDYYKYVVESGALDIYGRNTYGTWQP